MEQSRGHEGENYSSSFLGKVLSYYNRSGSNIYGKFLLGNEPDFAFYMQMVHNGDHKCSKRSQAENSAENTISEVLLTLS